MRTGEQLRMRGPAGAEFVLTVGEVFDEHAVQARIDSGEWTPLVEDAPAPASSKRTARKTAAKKTAARKETDTSEEGDGHGD
jgi:hypothetical protein